MNHAVRTNTVAVVNEELKPYLLLEQIRGVYG